jgi:hypothetical protein
MKTLILIVVATAAVGALLVAARLGQLWHEQHRTHDPVEYYESWAGYSLPIHLSHRITKERAETQAARGYAYMIGYFNADGKRIRDVKMLRGEVFFENEYTYDPRGRLTRIKTTNPDGVVRFVEYPEGWSRRIFW